MTHERTLELLDDYVGGELPPREERDVRRHLMQCDTCRAEEQVLRTLLDEAAELPEEIAPPRDLWQGIAPRLEARTGTGTATERLDEVRTIGPRPVRPLPWWMLAAASIALVITTSLLTLRFSGGRGTGPDVVLPAQQAQSPGATNAALASFRPAEQEYEKAIADLQAVLQARRSQLAPETVATLEANLRIIDQAIRESRSALAADPSSPELTKMLSDTYDAKLNVLRRAVSL